MVKWLKLKFFHGLSGIDIGNYWVRFFSLSHNERRGYSKSGQRQIISISIHLKLSVVQNCFLLINFNSLGKVLCEEFGYEVLSHMYIDKIGLNANFDQYLIRL